MCEFHDGPDVIPPQDGCCSIYWSLDSSSVSSKASDDCYQVRLNIELDDSTCLDLPWRNNRPAQIESSRKHQLTNCRHIPHDARPAYQVARRNARERRRVQTVNAAFSRLHDLVPTEFGCPSCELDDDDDLPHSARSKRSSKVTTLKRTIKYIQLLQRTLNQSTNDANPT